MKLHPFWYARGMTMIVILACSVNPRFQAAVPHDKKTRSPCQHYCPTSFGVGKRLQQHCHHNRWPLLHLWGPLGKTIESRLHRFGTPKKIATKNNPFMRPHQPSSVISIIQRACRTIPWTILLVRNANCSNAALSHTSNPSPPPPKPIDRFPS